MRFQIKLLFFCFFLLKTIFLSYSQEQAYKLIENISYTDAYKGEISEYMQDRCRLDIYYPEDKHDYATVVWFHGGGLTGGNKYIPEDLKDRGLAIVAVNYRLYPKIKCPVYIEDAAASVAWVFKNISKYGGSTSKIFVSGHSAGGYLSSMLGLDKTYLAEFGIDADSIAGLIPFSGHTITHFTVRKEMGIDGRQPIIDKYAPLYHVRPNAPPLVLLTGDRELELLGRYEENAYMYRMMKVAGHEETSIYEFEGFDHGGMRIPGYYILIKEIDKILKTK